MNRRALLMLLAALVVAGCGGGDGGTGPGTVPAAPDNLIATPVSPHRIDLLWNDMSTNEDGFRIQVHAAGVWSDAWTTPADTAHFTIAGLTPNTTYTFRVYAYNGDGASDYSNTATTITPPEDVAPAAPTDLEATALSPYSIRLNWVDASVNETGFRVEAHADGGWFLVEETAANAVSVVHDGLMPNTLYEYRVRAFNIAGSSAWSESASARTPGAGSVTIAAGNVSGVPGVTVSVPITMATSLASLSGYHVTVQYDAARLTLIDARQERLGFPMFQYASPEAGQVSFAATAVTPIDVSNGAIATLRFQIREGASGSAVVAPAEAEVSDADLHPIAATTLTPGAVQIQ